MNEVSCEGKLRVKNPTNKKCNKAIRPVTDFKVVPIRSIGVNSKGSVGMISEGCFISGEISNVVKSIISKRVLL